MTKEIYDFITTIGVTCLNWPVRINQTEPTFLKFMHDDCQFTLHKDCTIKDIINELGTSYYKTGYTQGFKKGKQSIRLSFKELLEL